MTALNRHAGLLFSAVVILSLSLAPRASAEIVVFEREYTYRASDIDSKVTSRAIAVEQVKRLVLEELGTYLMAETEIRDFHLTKDKVVTLTAGIAQTEILNEKWDGETYYLKARIKADPKEVAASIDMLRKDAQKSKELDDAKKKADDAYREIERLRRELEAAKSDTGKQREYARAADALSAGDWFEKGYQYALKNEHDRAIEAYTSAIALDPAYADSYTNRGLVYIDKKQYDRALEDFDRAVALDPNYARAYYNRGVTYSKKGRYDKTLSDLNKSIELNPKDADAYNTRGLLYGYYARYDKAIEDFDKAISLKTDFADAYNNRGLAKSVNGSLDPAIEDFDKAISLKPDFADAYNNRGLVHGIKGLYGKAASDYQKACGMGYEAACENLRGLKTP